VPVQKQTPPRSAPDTEGGSSARLPSIRSIPTTYRGTYFRSRLEARWAATFDQLGWYWEYEPDGVDMDGVRYLCDFWLPHQRCWVEVKGPTNDRLDKTNQLRKAVPDHDLVVIGRPAGPGGLANWQGVDTDNVGIFTCHLCHRSCFLIPLIQREGQKPFTDWRCRNCGAISEPGKPSLDPFSRIDSASFIEAKRREWSAIGDSHGHPSAGNLGDVFVAEMLTGLPFATIPRSAR
jgi:hypothetical protein